MWRNEVWPHSWAGALGAWSPCATLLQSLHWVPQWGGEGTGGSSNLGRVLTCNWSLPGCKEPWKSPESQLASFLVGSPIKGDFMVSLSLPFPQASSWLLPGSLHSPYRDILLAKQRGAQICSQQVDLCTTHSRDYLKMPISTTPCHTETKILTNERPEGRGELVSGRLFPTLLRSMGVGV